MVKHAEPGHFALAYNKQYDALSGYVLPPTALVVQLVDESPSKCCGEVMHGKCS